MQPAAGPNISPTEKYSARAYFESSGGVFGSDNVWVEVTNQESNDVKTIYYANDRGNVLLEWEDEFTLFIRNEGPMWPDRNDKSIRLNVESEIYHDQRQACFSLLMKNDYERCYWR